MLVHVITYLLTYLVLPKSTMAMYTSEVCGRHTEVEKTWRHVFWVRRLDFLCQMSQSDMIHLLMIR